MISIEYRARLHAVENYALEGIHLFARTEAFWDKLRGMKGKLTDSLAGAVGNESLFKGRRIGSWSNEDNVGFNLGSLSTFRSRARWRTTSRHLCLRRTDADVISSADSSDTAIYTEESAGTRVVTGRDDVGDTQ